MSKSSLLSQIGMLFSARVMAPVLRMPVIIGISRALGAEDLGSYQIIMAYFLIFESIVPLGLWTFTIREVGIDKSAARRLVSNGCVLGLLAALPCVVAMQLFGQWYESSTRIGLRIISLALIPAGASFFSEAALIGLDRGTAVAKITVIGEGLFAVLACTLLWLDYGVTSIVIVFLLARTFSAALRLGVLIARSEGTDWHLSKALMARMLKEAPVFFTATVSSTVFWRLDILMLSWLTSAQQVGFYTAALRIVTLCQEAPKAILLPLLPRFSEMFARADPGLRRLAAKSRNWLLLLSLGLTITLTLTGKSVIRLIFSSEFDSAHEILLILVWVLIPFSLMKLLGTLLIASRNQRSDMMINVVALIVNFILNFALIATYGTKGAAIATVISVTTALALRARFLRLHES